MIYLPMTNNPLRFAVIDDVDAARVIYLTWHLSKSNGVRRTDGDRIQLHRLIMCAPTDALVDHRDGDQLNNRRYNLRLATIRQNVCNRRKSAGTNPKRLYKGIVEFPGRKKPWHARIKVHRQTITLGYFETQEDAARAYDHAAREHFGEFACTNFPVGQERSAIYTPGHD